jgi:NAD(P)-dependent dehydrogenase (short-subunit alcohol dehydrogenase family)
MQTSDQVVVITGASGNLGKAVVEALRPITRIALFERDASKVEKHFPGILADDRAMVVDSVDLTNAEKVEQAVQKVISKFGRVDSLIHTVGGYRGGTTFHETELSEWEFMLDLNATSSFIICRSVIPGMLENGAGSIVLIGARPGIKGVAKGAAYSASKSAVLRLVESITAEYKTAGIRINAVLPGTIDTPENRVSQRDADHDRWVPPENIASVIAFLISPASKAIMGAAIPVYGMS